MMDALQLSFLARQLEIGASHEEPAAASLRDFSGACGDERTARRLETLAGELEAGATLTEVVAAHRSWFPDPFPAFVEIGERSGRLAEVMAQAARYFRHLYAHGRSLRLAAFYPLVVLGLALPLLVGEVILGLLYRSGGEAVIRRPLSWVGAANGVLLGLVLVAVALWLVPDLRRRVVAWLPWCPGLGRIVRRATLEHLAALAGALSGAGFELRRALADASAALGDHAYAAGVARFVSRLNAGARVEDELESSSPFPPFFTGMLLSGVRAENPAHALGMLADHYHRLNRGLADSVLALLQPLLLLLVAAAILLLVLNLDVAGLRSMFLVVS